MNTKCLEPQASLSQTSACATDKLLDGLYKTHLIDQADLIAKANGLDAKDVAKLIQEDCSSLGAWLSGEGQRKYGHLREYDLLLAAHQSYRCVMAIVANVAAQGQTASLQQALIDSLHLKSASQAVGVATHHLRSVA